MRLYVSLVPSDRKGKKWKMIFTTKDHIIISQTHFGSEMSDYTLHKDEHRKQLFLKRFQRLIEKHQDDPSSAMTLSHLILWNKPTIEESFQDYKRRFRLK